MLQAQLHTALTDLNRERAAHERLEVSVDHKVDEHCRALLSLWRTSTTSSSSRRPTRTTKPSLATQLRELQGEVTRRLDIVINGNAAIASNLAAVQREKGTKSPSPPLEHLFLTSEFARLRNSKSIRCTSGQKKYCIGVMSKLDRQATSQILMRKTGNGIDLRQYVKAFVNDRINENPGIVTWYVTSCCSLLCCVVFMLTDA